MANLQNLNLLYDSTSALSAGVVSIDLECNASNKIVKSVVIDTSTPTPVEVNKISNPNTIVVTKITNCDNSFYYVSDTIGFILDKQKNFCTADECNNTGSLSVTVDFTPLIDKLNEVIANDDTNTTNIIDAIEDLKTDTNIINGIVNDNLLAGQTASVNIDFLGLVSTENYNVEVKHNYGQSVTMIGQVVENDKVNVQITPQTLLVAPINFDVHVKQNVI
jgi:hypothetical protein